MRKHRSLILLVALSLAAPVAESQSRWDPGANAPAALEPRSRHAMAFDSARGVVVLFGGSDAVTHFNDVWEYNGRGWNPGPSGPSARAHHAMVYDSARSLVVVFGGSDAAVMFQETWEYDGSTWYLGAQAPPDLTPRWTEAAYDSARQVTVIFGGRDMTFVPLNDTWEYDGSAWRAGPQAPASMEPRFGHAMAYDSARGRILVMGGYVDFWYAHDDLWEYDGAVWQELAELPGHARNGHDMAFDASRETAVVFGGGYCSPCLVHSVWWNLDDTWLFDGSGWSAGPTAPAGLVARSGHAMAFDARRGVVVMFGGSDDLRTLDDTWELTLPCPPIHLSPSSLLPATLGVAYRQTLSANGGTPPYRYQVTGGTLPPGLTLYPGGVLTGVPTDLGVFDFTIGVQDRQDCTGSRAYTLHVNPVSSHVVGQGLGQPNPNRVRVFDQSGAATSVDFYAYAAGFWGVNVASGDVVADGYGEILTGPGPGDVFGPQVRGFRRNATPMGKINFYAYGTLKYGVNVASGDLEADGFDEIISGAGPGDVFGPHVRGWDFDATAISAIPKINYFAYGTLQHGANVGQGDVDGDWYTEILTGPGPGIVFGTQVRGWNFDGTILSAIGTINFNAYLYSYGVNVTGGDVDADSFDEIATAPGPGPTNPPQLRGFDYDATQIASKPGFFATPNTTLYGARVGLADITVDAAEDLLGGLGPDPAADATVYPYSYDGTGLSPLPTFNPFPGSYYGVNVAGGDLGY